MDSSGESRIEERKRLARAESDQYGYRQRFRTFTTEALISAFNEQVGVPWWVTARSYYLVALSDALVATDLDCSAFISDYGTSLSARIERRGDAIVPDDGDGRVSTDV